MARDAHSDTTWQPARTQRIPLGAAAGPCSLRGACARSQRTHAAAASAPALATAGEAPTTLAAIAQVCEPSLPPKRKAEGAAAAARRPRSMAPRDLGASGEEGEERNDDDGDAFC